MTAPEFEGIFAIVPTPLTESGDVDETGLRALVEYCCEQEFNGIVVLGSNGEFPYLNFSEKAQVIGTAADQAKGRTTVVAGVSAHGTDQALALIREAKLAGCDAVMAALPAYFALDMEQILFHFRTLGDEGGLPVFFYYFPDTTGLILTPDQISEIADLDGIVGAKLTLTSVPFLKEVIDKTRDKNFAPFTGMSLLLKDFLELGGVGVFCPLPILSPEDIKAVWDAHQAGNQSRCEELQNKVRGALPIFTGLDMKPEDAATIFKNISG
ncbi:MAG: dihydrodipicolinate synthase family protein, partial [Proteobacteria bacterium]|nr:dihydrodipicolinate synthase family protein [Pseudomonadota bacterium]